MEKIKKINSMLEKLCGGYKDNFKTTEEFQSYLRQEGEIPDNVTIGGILFTQDNYDNSGEEISYGNMRTQKTLFINTENRYESKSDARVTIEDFLFGRNGFPYKD